MGFVQAPPDGRRGREEGDIVRGRAASVRVVRDECALWLSSELQLTFISDNPNSKKNAKGSVLPTKLWPKAETTERHRR